MDGQNLSRASDTLVRRLAYSALYNYYAGLQNKINNESTKKIKEELLPDIFKRLKKLAETPFAETENSEIETNNKDDDLFKIHSNNLPTKTITPTLFLGTRYQALLKVTRDEAKEELQSGKDIRQCQLTLSEKLKTVLATMWDDICELLHASELKQQVCLIVQGSLARGDAAPYSDIEYALLIKETRPELQWLTRMAVQWFELLMVSSGESCSTLYETMHVGFRVDQGAWKLAELCDTAEQLADHFCKLDNAENPDAYAMLISAHVWGAPSLYEDYAKAINQHLQHDKLHRLWALRRLDDNRANYLYAVSDEKEQKHEDIKKRYLRWLTYLAMDLALYYQLSQTHPIDVMNELQRRHLISKAFANSYIRCYLAIVKRRMQLHCEKLFQCDESRLDEFPELKRIYEEAERLLLQPYIKAQEKMLHEEMLKNVNGYNIVLMFKKPPVIEANKIILIKESNIIIAHYCIDNEKNSKLLNLTEEEIKYLEFPENDEVFVEFKKDKNSQLFSKILLICVYRLNKLDHFDEQSATPGMVKLLHHMCWEFSLASLTIEVEPTSKLAIKIESSSFEKPRYLRDSLIKEVIDIKTGLLREDKNTKHGRRLVIAIECEGQIIAYFKFFPELAGSEFAVSHLQELLFGDVYPRILLAKFTVTINGKETIYPVLISEAMLGDNLQDCFEKNKNYALPKNINLKDYTRETLLALLTFPGDGKPDGQVLVPTPQETSGEETLSVRVVDKEQSFLSHTIGDNKKLQLNSLLFCMKQMGQAPDKTVLAHFAKQDALKIFEQWLKDCQAYNRAQIKLFGKEKIVLWHNLELGFLQKFKQKFSSKDNIDTSNFANLLFPFGDEGTNQIYHRCYKLQIITKQLNTTFYDFLHAVTQRGYCAYKTIDKRLSLYAHYLELGKTEFNNITNTNQLFTNLRGLHLIETLPLSSKVDNSHYDIKQLMEEKEFSPKQGLECLIQIKEDLEKQVELITKNLMNGEIKNARQKLKAIQKCLLSQVFSTLHFKNILGDLEQQTEWLDLILEYGCENIDFSDCEVLTKQHLILLTKRYKTTIERLNVSNCGGIQLVDLEKLSYFEQLSSFEHLSVLNASGIEQKPESGEFILLPTKLNLSEPVISFGKYFPTLRRLLLNDNIFLTELTIAIPSLEVLDLGGCINLCKVSLNHCGKLHTLIINTPLDTLDLSNNPTLTDGQLTVLLSHISQLRVLILDNCIALRNPEISIEGLEKIKSENCPYLIVTNKNSDYYNKIGNKRCQSEQYTKGIENYSKAIELNPNKAEYYNNCGAAYFKLQNYPKAIENYSKAIKLSPKDDVYYNNRGDAYLELQNYPAAIEDYTKAIEFDPKNIVYYSNCGDIYLKLKNYQSAIENYTKAIKLFRKNSITIMLTLPKYLPHESYHISFRGGNPDISYNVQYFSENFINSIIPKAMEPKGAAFYNKRGDAYFHLKNYLEAIEDYNIAIVLDSENAVYYNNGGNACINLKKYSTAIEYYTAAIKLNPNNAVYYNNRGCANLELTNYELAIEDYTKAIKLNPKNATYYNNYNNAYIKKYTQAIELNPNNDVHYNNRGRTYLELTNYEAAIEDFSKAIELNPKAASYHYNRGGAYYYLKNYKVAIKDFSKAIELDPGHGDSYCLQGNAYYNLKDYEAAIKNYTKAIELNSKNDAYYYLRGEAYYNLKNYEAAIENYSQAIELNPDNDEYYTNRSMTKNYFGELNSALQDCEQAIILNEKISVYHRRYSCIHFFYQHYDDVISLMNQALVCASATELLWCSEYKLLLQWFDTRQVKKSQHYCQPLINAIQENTGEDPVRPLQITQWVAWFLDISDKTSLFSKEILFEKLDGLLQSKLEWAFVYVFKWINFCAVDNAIEEKSTFWHELQIAMVEYWRPKLQKEWSNNLILHYYYCETLLLLGQTDTAKQGLMECLKKNSTFVMAQQLLATSIQLEENQLSLQDFKNALQQSYQPLLIALQQDENKPVIEPELKLTFIPKELALRTEYFIFEKMHNEKLFTFFDNKTLVKIAPLVNKAWYLLSQKQIVLRKKHNPNFFKDVFAVSKKPKKEEEKNNSENENKNLENTVNISN